jgi:eukaryotic-like serine/threonine-protein kinase
MLGTVSYMSPEQVRGEKLDSRTDLFSFGLVLYEMATGQRAFRGNTVVQVNEAILHRAPAPARDWNAELPPDLERIIDKALQKDREMRYQSASEIRTDLQRLRRDTRTGSNTSAAVLRHSLSVLPWWRNKLATGIGGLIVVSMILAAGFSWWHRPSLPGGSGPRLAYRQITFIGDAIMPAISPDGKFLAYVTTESESKQKLMMQALSGGPSLELLHGRKLLDPRWSPDGSELMVRVRENDPAKRGLFVVSRLGGAPQPVGEALSYFCWLPDESQVVAASQDSETGIWLINRQTGQEKQLPAPRYSWLHDIDCSAKTGMLLLLTQTDEKYQIWTMRPDGTEQRKLIEEQKEIDSLRWSPTGDAIYYFRREGDTTDLVKLSIGGQATESSVLVSGLETGDKFTLSADGSLLAYTRTLNFSNLWLAELSAHGATSGVQQKPLTSGTLSYSDPSISPDGRWVAFASGPHPKTNIYKMTIDGGQPVQLTFFDAAMSASPTWSPDGQRIAFISNQGGTPKVWVINAGGGTPHSLDKTNASTTNYRVAWYPNPEIVYQQPGLHNLRRLNVETQKEESFLLAD